jgi:hypothetical protein
MPLVAIPAENDLRMKSHFWGALSLPQQGNIFDFEYFCLHI